MNMLKTQGVIDEQGRLRLDVPTHLPPGPVDVVMVIQPAPERSSEARTYDFSNLTGRLEWRGDALAAQRELRNEW
jgi:hypothetical protein